MLVKQDSSEVWKRELLDFTTNICSFCILIVLFYVYVFTEEVDRPPTAQPEDDVDSELSEEDEYLDERLDYLDEISLRVNPTWKRRIKDLFFSDTVSTNCVV